MMPPWLPQMNPQVIRCWRGSWEAATVEPARYLYEHELVLVTAGGCALEVGGRTLELHAGDYVIIPPGCLHVSVALSEGVHRVCIHFDWVYTPQRPVTPICSYFPDAPAPDLMVAAPEFVPDSLGVGTFEAAGPVPALIEQLFQRWFSGDAISMATARSLLLELLTRLLWSKTATQTAMPDRSAHLAAMAKHLLDSQAKLPGGVRALLATLGFSYEHLSRVFREHYGTTPLAYLNAQRLERARAQLADPRLTIAEIAYQNGFCDAGYFTRKFRRHYGRSPSQARPNGFDQF